MATQQKTDQRATASAGSQVHQIDGNHNISGKDIEVQNTEIKGAGNISGKNIQVQTINNYGPPLYAVIGVVVVLAGAAWTGFTLLEQRGTTLVPPRGGTTVEPHVSPREQSAPVAPSTHLTITVAPVAVAGTAYPVGDERIPAQEVAGQLREELIDQLTQTGHFSVQDGGLGGHAGGEVTLVASDETPAGAPALRWVARLESLGYPRHATKVSISDDPVVTYSGGARLSYQLVNAATQQIVLNSSVSTTLPSLGPTFHPLTVNGAEKLHQLETGLISKVVQEIVSRAVPHQAAVPAVATRGEPQR